MSGGPNKEALRQQMLLRALWPDGGSTAWQGYVRGLSALKAGRDAGIAAYRGNAAAIAERALAGAYPTVAELIGAENFAALARDLWRTNPPERGDLGEWGGVLPAFIAASAQLADEPYLADSAALDWAVHRASRAADEVTGTLLPIEALAQAHAGADPARITLRLRPGTAIVESAAPIVAIWLAHQRPADDPERFAEVRAAFAADPGPRAETALVWRDGMRVRVAALDRADLAFTRALIEGCSLAAALDAADPAFAFDRWLPRALAARWLAGLQPLESST
ncbi:MAG TPA: putative DNA-binding domain-containing protein [Burkholderiaceae bacterium]|nr:putative DNA-binding domain-containing protein [Burkholderiaceae bacterium]